MTFLEAAIEVLRDATEPLHFSEIATRAVQKKLLSHVGRDPEAAMRGCLTSAVRGDPADALVRRAKPAHYEIKPGAKLPDRPEPAPEPEPEKPKAKKKTAKKATAKTAAKKKSAKKKAVVRKRGKSADAEAGAGEPAEAEESGAAAAIEFEAPAGSGLSGPTDVALVMANAMSRLVDERPELKTELDAMQAQPSKAEAPADAGPKVERRSQRGRTRVDGEEAEERGGRKRRRRRRRSKKVEWRGGAEATPAGDDGSVLDAVAKALGDAGPRSMHVRQIAEHLASQNVRGGDISELERTITTAIVLDVHRHGGGSRFAMRGDARYQLRGSRVPAGAAKAEAALYSAARAAESASRSHLRVWLSSLGARGFEALVRAYLETERYELLTSLPQVRGLGRIVVRDPDPEETGRILVLAVPAKTPVDRKLWDGELERNECSSVLVIAAGAESAGDWGPDVRLLPGTWFSHWLVESGIGVRRVQLTVPVLDPEVIESIGGLDT